MYSGEIVKVDDLLLNLVVVFEACRIKCDSISGRRRFKAAGYPRKERKNSALLLIAYRHP